MTLIQRSPRINNHLRYFRKLRGYKQEEIAELVGVQSDQISKWERGRKLPCLENAMKLSKVYHRPIADLFPDLNAKVEEEINEKILQRYEQQRIN